MTTQQLDIFVEHPVPLVFITGRLIVLGTSGAGKTSSARVMAEEAWNAKLRFGVIDLQSDWSGLKSSADGTKPGIPVVIFGGDHADVPLDPAAAVLTAEIVADLEQPFVLDMGNWSKTKQVRFIGPFLERLMEIMPAHSPMVLFCDEVDVYAPQKPMSPEANITLSNTVDVAKRGRKRGVFPVFVTQRNSGVNKDITELCQVLLIYRTPGFLDQKVVENALGRTVTKERTAEILAEVEGLPNGTAIVVSKLPELRILETLRVRLPATFDSSATPELGKRRREPKVLAQPDLEALRTKLSTQLERQKADDPKALHATITTLRKELEAERKRQPAPANAETKTVTKFVLRDGEIARVEKLVDRWVTTLDKIRGEMTRNVHVLTTRTDVDRNELYGVVNRIHTALSAPPPTVPAARSLAGSNGGGAVRAGLAAASPSGTPRAESGHGAIPPRRTGGTPRSEDSARTPERAEGVTGPQQRILDALAALEAIGVESGHKTQVALFAQASPTSSSYQNNLGAMRSAGLIEYPAGSLVRLTNAGRAIANAETAPRTTEELHEHLRRMLSNPQWRIVSALVRAYPDALTKAELAERAEASAGSSSFQNNLGALRSLGLIDYPTPGMVAARALLFLEERVA